jgi:pyruvate dehydrogenase E1 component
MVIVMFNMVPNCVTYDPTYGYEVAVIVQDGIQRMYGDNENVFFYLTVLNENYVQPQMPKGCEKGILRGMYKIDTVKAKHKKLNVQLLGCGAILEQVRKAATILAEEYDINSTVYSVTSFNELARDGLDVERWNMLHPELRPKQAYITELMEKEKGPAIAATDYIKLYADQVRAWVPTQYKVLGTDGFGRSDSRANLRHHFEVDYKHVVVAALSELVKQGELDSKVAMAAIEKYEIDIDRINPLHA